MMASRTKSLGTHEIDFLRETLHAQQELLQKLYNELDVERESSATAADEALSMILRLQGEKAALEMETSQYRRIAEEKMCHAQETLEIFQELIFQKEMQIASLEFQVQAYKFKLVSMGYDDLGVSELQYPENMLSRRNGFSGEASSQGTLRRGSSLPPPLLDAMSRRTSTEGPKSSQSSPKARKEIKDAESSIQREHTVVDYNSYLDEIRKLDERVKELAHIKGSNDIFTSESTNGMSKSYSVDLPTITPPICNPSPETSIKSDCYAYVDKVTEVQACGDSQCPPCVQDIFEVPECSDNYQNANSHEKEKRKLSLEDEGRQGKLASVWNEFWKSDVKEKIDWERKPLLSPGSIGDSPKSTDINEKFDLERRPLISPGRSNEPPKPKDGKSTDKGLLIKQTKYRVTEFELQQFNRRLKQLEDDRFVTRGHDISVGTDAEELRLLREIMDRVDSMQAEITSWRTKKPPLRGDNSVGCLKEVMLCFWP